MIKLNHKHIIVNAVIRKPPTVHEELLVVHWLEQLIEAVGMKIVIGPNAHYCTAQDNEGMTASVNIETSHASLHVWDRLDPPILRFDLYSCADFDINTVLYFIKEFEATEIEYLVLDRNDTHMMIKDWTQMTDFSLEIPQHLAKQ